MRQQVMVLCLATSAWTPTSSAGPGTTEPAGPARPTTGDGDEPSHAAGLAALCDG
ncbi:hypothetical protein QFZ66_008431 [Streptomyces sp. B4I13]|nr:hypothetical protein [Streptomyces sp. B4I13]